MATEEPALTVEQRDALVSEAIRAKARAYCPYSKFRVGAALLADDGTVVAGCNVENASYGLSMCAERVAAVKAVSSGLRAFRAIAVATDVQDEFCTPCGACRQFLAEFGLALTVILSTPNGATQSVALRDLLPMAFCPETLDEAKRSTRPD